MEPRGVEWGQLQKTTEPDRRTFAELTDAEKIERLRNVVDDLQRSLGWAHEQATKAKAMAENHEHGHDGRPLFPAHVLSSTGLVGSAKNQLV